MAGKKRIRVGWLTTVTWGIATAVWAEVPGPVLAAHIQNRAKLDPSTLEAVTGTVSGVFRKAGVELRWVEDLERVTGTWVLLVLDHRAPPDVGIVPTALGYACCAGSEVAGIAYAFVDRIERVARTEGQTVTSVLAYVVAHEIGHVLLGAQPHSTGGIMQNPWNRSTFLRLAQGTLYFFPDQASRIRQRLAAVAPRRGK